MTPRTLHEVLEAAAKVCDAQTINSVHNELTNASDYGAMKCAVAIRALAAQWPDGVIVPEHVKRISIPTTTMEQEFQSHYRRGYAAGLAAARRDDDKA